MSHYYGWHLCMIFRGYFRAENFSSLCSKMACLGLIEKLFYRCIASSVTKNNGVKTVIIKNEIE